MKNHFTIIIPAYNCEEWAEWNLTSVLRQNYDPLLFDVVYVDDHSSDNTFGIVSDIYDKFENNLAWTPYPDLVSAGPVTNTFILLIISYLNSKDLTFYYPKNHGLHASL